MIATSTTILPRMAPATGSRSLLSDAEGQCADQGSHEVADAAEDHDQKTVDDVDRAEIGADIADLAQRHARHPGDPGAEAEGQRVDPRGADPHRRGHRAVLGHGAHMQPERGPIEDQRDRAQHDEAEQDDVEPVPGDGEAADRVEAAGHPTGVGDRSVRRAEDRAHRLLQDEPDAPGRQQGFERPAVQETDHRALEDDPDRAGDEKPHRDRDDEIGAEPVRRQECAKELLADKSGIGAEHDHLAMRHVDDAHHAEGDGEPDRGQQQHAAEADALEQIGGEANEPQALADRRQRVVDRPAQLRIGPGPVAQLVEEVLDLRVGGPSEPADRRQLLLPRAGQQPAGEQALLHRRANFGIGLDRQRLFEPGDGFGRGMLQRIAGGREAGVAVGAEQGQRRQRRLDLAAQPIVDDDAGEAVGGDARNPFAGRGVAERRPGPGAGHDHHPAVGGGSQAVVAQRLQDRDGARVAEPAQGDDGRRFRGEAVIVEGGDQRGEALRARRQRRGQQDQRRRDHRDRRASIAHSRGAIPNERALIGRPGRLAYPATRTKRLTPSAQRSRASSPLRIR